MMQNKTGLKRYHNFEEDDASIDKQQRLIEHHEFITSHMLCTSCKDMPYGACVMCNKGHLICQECATFNCKDTARCKLCCKEVEVVPNDLATQLWKSTCLRCVFVDCEIQLDSMTEWNAHNLVCPKRGLKCDSCSFIGTEKELAKHMYTGKCNEVYRTDQGFTERAHEIIDCDVISTESIGTTVDFILPSTTYTPAIYIRMFIDPHDTEELKIAAKTICHEKDSKTDLTLTLAHKNAYNSFHLQCKFPLEPWDTTWASMLIDPTKYMTIKYSLLKKMKDWNFTTECY